MSLNRTIYDPAKWQAFKNEVSQIQGSGLRGDALYKRLELAWSPLFEGIDEFDGAQMHEEVMHYLVHVGALPQQYRPPY